MTTWINSINPVNDGELVNQAVTNRSINAIINNLQYLKSVISSGTSAGSAIISASQPVSTSTVVGTPVWYNGTTLEYEPAQAIAIQDPTTSALVLAPQANCVGIVVNKENATTGDILLAGKYTINIASVTNNGQVTSARYYLSSTVAGQLTTTRPPITVSVLYADGDGTVHVLPQIRDFFLGDHVHYNFNLVALPAGIVTPPAIGYPHVISSPNPASPGWLPANSSVFNGLAPANAVFGYNIAQDLQLSAVWPPIPLSAYSINITKYNATQAPMARYTNIATLQFDLGSAIGPQSYGVQGAQTSIYPGEAFGPIGGQGPVGSQYSWELAVPVPQALIGDQAFAEPLSQLPPDLVWDAYVVTPGYVNVRLGTLTGKTTVVPPVVWIVGVEQQYQAGTPVNPINLCTIDQNGIWWLSNCYGDAPWPTTYNNSVVGPIIPGPQCPRPSTAMAINLAFSRLSFGSASQLVTTLQPGTGSPITVQNAAGTTNNNGDLYLGLKLQREIDSRITLLTGVYEANVGFHYWDFPQGIASSLRGEFELSSLYVGNNPTLQLRLLLYGPVYGTLGKLVFTYRRLSRPFNGATAPPTVDTVGTINTAVTLNAGQYVEVLSTPVPCAAGDVFIFNLARNVSDGYAGDIGLIRVQGILVGS